jgi:hypothetical protein
LGNKSFFSAPQLKREPLDSALEILMSHLVGRMSAVIVAGLCAFWILALITLPIMYARAKGWGYYWAFSLDEVLGSLLLLLGPPALLLLVWRRSRKQRGGEGAI